MRNVIIKTPGGKLFLGTIENRAFTRANVSGKAHMYREIPSWGMDKEAFDDIISKESDVIRILDTDTNIGYKISTEKFKKHSAEREFEGHRKQLFCSVVFFHKYHPDKTVELPLDEMGEKKEDPQMTLL